MADMADMAENESPIARLRSRFGPKPNPAPPSTPAAGRALVDPPAAPLVNRQPQRVRTAAPRRPDPARGKVCVMEAKDGRRHCDWQSPMLPISATCHMWCQEGDAEWTYPAKG